MLFVGGASPKISIYSIQEGKTVYCVDIYPLPCLVLLTHNKYYKVYTRFNDTFSF